VLSKTGTLTKVKVNFEMNWELQHIETIRFNTQQNPQAYEWVPIDLLSLGSFVLKSYSKEHRDQAMEIMAIAELYKESDQWAQLPMLKRPADSGRMYYGGINLQNCPAVVRHAALGQHHSYDLRSSVYAWQIYMLRMIQNTGRYDRPAGTICTRELIDDKDAVRRRLAQVIKDTGGSFEHRVGIVKQAITAIGFGARSSNAYYNQQGQLVTQGLAGIIFNKQARAQFLSDAWVCEFLKEQDQIGRQICESVLTIAPEYRTDPVVANNGKLSRKRLLAFLYQQSESRMIKHIMEYCEKFEVILWIHDGFCTRHPINLPDANALLAMDYGDGIQLLHTRHNEWYEVKPEPIAPAAERAQRHQAEQAWHQQRTGVSIGDSSQESARIATAQLRAREYYKITP
jgi:hypothetical protein